MKKTPDYDNVFKTMKMKHKRLFISVINDVFKKNYPTDMNVEVLPSDRYLTENETPDGSKEVEEQISDFLIRIWKWCVSSRMPELWWRLHGDQDSRICFYRCKAVCNVGHRACNNTDAKVFCYLCQEDGQDTENDDDHLYVSRWADGWL